MRAGARLDPRRGAGHDALAASDAPAPTKASGMAEQHSAVSFPHTGRPPEGSSPEALAGAARDAGGVRGARATGSGEDAARANPGTSAALIVRGVEKAYRLGGERVAALRGVDITIQDRGFYAIMGQSGSGKSTLLHLLATLDRPDAGEIVLAGRAIHTLTEGEATVFRRRNVGIVFQQFNLIPTLTARENVELPGLLAGEDRDALAARSKALLERLGMWHRAGHRPDALSGGEQQRVAIARSLVFEPPILLADEPTGNLDSASSGRLWGLLAEVARERGMLVVMVTHEPAAASHCARAFVLADGRVKGVIETEGLDAVAVAARYQQCVSAS
jgi:putative ABC transport system ATP-binding protein